MTYTPKSQQYQIHNEGFLTGAASSAFAALAAWIFTESGFVWQFWAATAALAVIAFMYFVVSLGYKRIDDHINKLRDLPKHDDDEWRMLL